MDKLEIFRGTDFKWYWHVQAANGRIIQTGGQGFRTKWGAKRSAKRTTGLT